MHYLFYLLESIHDLLRKNLGIDLCCLDVGVAKHLAHYLDGDSRAEGYGGGEGVSAYMGGEVLVDAGFFLDEQQLFSVCFSLYMWKIVVVSF